MHFLGATASLRGSAGFCAFAGAKHALRALSQSMARELGPKNIHVAHVIIDGMRKQDEMVKSNSTVQNGNLKTIALLAIWYFLSHYLISDVRVLVSGAIDSVWIRENFPHLKKDEGVGLLKPRDIAETYFQIHAQKASAWTHELDLRNPREKW